MKIAVTYENGNVFQHFGHTRQFKLYEVENGAIRSETHPRGGRRGPRARWPVNSGRRAWTN